MSMPPMKAEKSTLRIDVDLLAVVLPLAVICALAPTLCLYSVARSAEEESVLARDSALVGEAAAEIGSLAGIAAQAAARSAGQGSASLAAALRGETLTKRLRALAAALPGRAFLVAVDGRIVLAAGESKLSTGLPSAAGAATGRPLTPRDRAPATAAKVRSGGEAWYVTRAVVDGTDWLLVTVHSAAKLFSLRVLISLAVATGLFAALMGFAAAFVLRRTAIGPVRRRLAVLAATSRSQETAIKENEILLRETHHRVKNDLQILSSLFSLQAGPGVDAADREILVEGRNRVRAISLIHELLYKSPNLNGVNIRSYFAELIGRIQRSLGAEGRAISISSRVEDFYFNPDTSLVCGLLLNELLTNSLKHAFPFSDSGSIVVSLERTAFRQFLLEVRDDGIGIPGACTAEGGNNYGSGTQSAETLGMELVRALTEQLGGTLAVESCPGTVWRIRFSAEEMEPPARHERSGIPVYRR